jgi:hypothetical protein
MRRFTVLLLVLCCSALLLLQMVGLHLHAGTNQDAPGLHAEHIHGADPDGEDHSSDVDVSLVHLVAVWAKLGVPLFGMTLLALVPALLSWWIRPDLRKRSLPATAGHWRPPLRAPPAFR